MWESPSSSCNGLLEEIIWDYPCTPNALIWTKLNELVDLGSKWTPSSDDPGFYHYNYWTIWASQCMPKKSNICSSWKWLASAVSPSLPGTNSAICAILSTGDCFVYSLPLCHNDEDSLLANYTQISQICADIPAHSLSWSSLMSPEGYSYIAVGTQVSTIRIYSINHSILTSGSKNAIFPLIQEIPLPTNEAVVQQLEWNSMPASNDLMSSFLAWSLHNGTFGVYDFKGNALVYISSIPAYGSMLKWINFDLLAIVALDERIQFFSINTKNIVGCISLPQLKFPGAPMALSCSPCKDSFFDVFIDVLTQPSLQKNEHKPIFGISHLSSMPTYIRIYVNTVDFTCKVLEDIGNPYTIDDSEEGSDGEESSLTPATSYYGAASCPLSGLFTATLSGFLFKSKETLKNKSVLKIGFTDLKGITYPRLLEIAISLLGQKDITNNLGWELGAICNIMISGWGGTLFHKSIKRYLDFDTGDPFEDLRRRLFFLSSINAPTISEELKCTKMEILKTSLLTHSLKLCRHCFLPADGLSLNCPKCFWCACESPLLSKSLSSICPL